MTDFSIEEQLGKQGFSRICGIDEVGRGALFGPVVAGAVILAPDSFHPEIDDSKKLSPRKRHRMAHYIYERAMAFSIGWSWNDEIDRINILQATRKAMIMAVGHLQIVPDFALVDGMDPAFLPIPGKKVVGGDRKSQSIAAASILAKVFRDDLLVVFSRFFPGFGFQENKGYPTKKHKIMLLLNGMTHYHRGSFVWQWPSTTE